MFLTAEKASEIHLADYLPSNLRETQRWIDRDQSAHDWRPFVRYTLQCEGVTDPTDEQVTAREELARAKITRLLRADAREAEPVRGRYGTVISAYCADSATADRATWELFMRNISGLVRPGGLFITSALRAPASTSWATSGSRARTSTSTTCERCSSPRSDPSTAMSRSACSPLRRPTATRASSSAPRRGSPAPTGWSRDTEFPQRSAMAGRLPA